MKGRAGFFGSCVFFGNIAADKSNGFRLFVDPAEPDLFVAQNVIFIGQGAVTVYVAAVFKSVEQCFESEVRRQMLAFFRNNIFHANPDALSTFELNLTKDECIDVRSISPQLAEALASDTAEEVYSRAYAQIIDENGKRDFESKFRRQALLDSFGAGHTSVQTEFQRYNDSGKLIWVRAYINMLENPETSDIEGIVYSVDITEEKRNEKIFRIISDEEYDYVALLHLGDRKMQFLNLSPRLLPKYHESSIRRRCL